MVFGELATGQVPYADEHADAVVIDYIKTQQFEELSKDCPSAAAFADIIDSLRHILPARRLSANEVVNHHNVTFESHGTPSYRL